MRSIVDMKFYYIEQLKWKKLQEIVDSEWQNNSKI